MASIRRDKEGAPIHRTDPDSHGFLNRRAEIPAHRRSPLRRKRKNGPNHAGLAQ